MNRGCRARANHDFVLKTNGNYKNTDWFQTARRGSETPIWGYERVWPRANHDVGLSFPSSHEGGPLEPNLAIKGRSKGAKDHPRDGQTRANQYVGLR